MVVFVACNPKTAQKVTEPTPTPEEESKPLGIESPTGTKSDKEVYTMLMYKKTPCYGKCPVYEVKISNDGKATYEGKMNVEKMGSFVGKVSGDGLKTLRDKLEMSGIYDFANAYPTDGKQISDLPTTIIEYRVGDMIKSIRDKHDAPAKLKDLEKWIEAYIESIEWTRLPK